MWIVLVVKQFYDLFLLFIYVLFFQIWEPIRKRVNDSLGGTFFIGAISEYSVNAFCQTDPESASAPTKAKPSGSYDVVVIC